MVNLKEWRESLGLTQPQMSRYVDVSLHTWRKWEQHQHGLSGAGLALVTLLQELENQTPSGFVDFRIDRARR